MNDPARAPVEAPEGASFPAACDSPGPGSWRRSSWSPGCSCTGAQLTGQRSRPSSSSKPTTPGTPEGGPSRKVGDGALPGGDRRPAPRRAGSRSPGLRTTSRNDRFLRPARRSCPATGARLQELLQKHRVFNKRQGPFCEAPDRGHQLERPSRFDPLAPEPAVLTEIRIG